METIKLTSVLEDLENPFVNIFLLLTVFLFQTLSVSRERGYSGGSCIFQSLLLKELLSEAEINFLFYREYKWEKM